jgi:broad specificity phosphatase PhoE
MFFVRHGESEFNAVFAHTGRDPGIIDAPLTPRGAEQAAAAGHLLRKSGITRIICSPYRRALQTAALIAGELKLPVAVTALVGERALYSCDVGRDAATLKKEWAAVDFSSLEDGEWWPRKGETQASIERRVHAFLAQENDATKAAQTLVVSHWYFLFTLSALDANNGEIIWRDEKGRFHKRV